MSRKTERLVRGPASAWGLGCRELGKNKRRNSVQELEESSGVQKKLSYVQENLGF